MSIIDTAAIFIKKTLLKVFLFSIIIATDLIYLGFLVSSLTLAYKIIIKFYNWFHSFKDVIEGTTSNSNSVVISLAKSSGILHAFADIFSIFILIYTVFIAYKVSRYLFKYSAVIANKIRDLAMLLDS